MQVNKLQGSQSKTALVNLFICLFILGWVTQSFALLNVGRYSILLLYVAAIPFCQRATQRSVIFVVLPLVSTVLAALVSLLLTVSNPMGIVSQGALQLLAIFFSAGVASIDWRKHFLPFSKALVVLGAPVVAFGGYQMVARVEHLKFAFLPVTNLQEYATGGLQRGWEKARFTRASSLFVEPSEFGYFCLWLLVIGLSLPKKGAHNGSGTGPWRVWAIALAFAGMLFSQSLSGALGVAVIFAVYLVMNPISFQVVRQLAIAAILSLTALVALEPLMPDAFDAFSQRIEQAVTLDNRADSGRVDHLPANWESFKEEPIWGHGLGSISSADPNGVDVTTFTYFLVLIERGAVGAVLFLAPWVWLGWRTVKMPRADDMRTFCALVSALNFYTFTTSSTAYFLPYWFALGICASCILSTYMPSTRLTFAGWNSVENFGS
jgi:O-antigen ligase